MMKRKNPFLREKMWFAAVIILVITITGCTGTSVKEPSASSKTKDGVEVSNGLKIQEENQENDTITNSDSTAFETESRILTTGTDHTDGGEISNVYKEDNQGQSQSKKQNEVELDRTTMSKGQIEPPFDLFPEYHIKPGDVLDVLYQVRTWTKKDKFKIAIDHTVSVKFVHSPELNETQIIRPDGNITLPYLGEVSPVGMTVVEFTNKLKKNYANILKNPEIYITVPEFRRNIKELKADLHTAPRGLSRLVTVRPDGQTTFAMIGHLDVAGKTVPQVNEELNKLYDEMVPGLHCDLFLERHSGSVVYVVGEVRSPGAYNIIKPISVLEAIALAGSHIPGAKLSSIIIARRNKDKVIATRLNLKKVLKLKEESKFFYLQPDDIVYVPRTFIKTAADVMNDIADIFMFRGWGANLTFTYELNDRDTSGRNNGAITPIP